MVFFCITTPVDMEPTPRQFYNPQYNRITQGFPAKLHPRTYSLRLKKFTDLNIIGLHTDFQQNYTHGPITYAPKNLQTPI